MLLASPAPPLEVGPQWADWVDAELAAEFEELRGDDRERLIPEYEAMAPQLAGARLSRMRRRPGQPDADRAALRIPRIANPLPAGIARGVATGIGGWFDDAVAQASSWGFSVRDIRVPVTVRHGGLDRMVDPRNGQWLAVTIPGARGEFIADAGHFSVVLPSAEGLETLLA